MITFESKVALVTGASRGIGRGIALDLARRGASVVINYRSHAEEAKDLARAIQDMGQQALDWQADVSDRQAVAEMIEATVDHFGQLDIAVANAAVEIPGPILETKWEDDLRTFEVNQFGVFHTCKYAAQQMVKQIENGGARGKIIIISSMCADVSHPGQASYNMSKAAVSHLGRSMARELVTHHINVNIIHPGWVDTPGERALFGDETIDEAWQHVPWGRIGQVEDIARAVTFLASDDAEFITGSTLVVDGGQQLLWGDIATAI